ncbi:uncharacterized protein K460DRAFT_355178 [Cucurbitaria berberidis CBS 394.84]|uniref:Uncharacterized protein n=1 Tax=Cucurbitaria berberidis CBS 394.84 TaxID=1168544 RepID=A0A9P4L8H3_9PLEO|nr:uncharacterized protein K460DRAFT_355178 [Cucurbitaria berberidis CBS 394.84]KAF1845347.1 hypothetical protein K460DRAFT_355178 [Cucurbitaria berberidis CBS 394.84]
MERSVATHAQGEEAHGHHHSPSIDHFVHIFLDNTKNRFGESSVEVVTINAILSTFRSGDISKRDALSSITLTLRDQEDLKQDLMNVLYHQDAKWGAGDFDFDQLITLPSPQSMQPTHEPWLRLPPITSLWYPEHQAARSINPAMLNNYGGPPNFGNQEYREPVYAQRGYGNWQPPYMSASYDADMSAIHEVFGIDASPSVLGNPFAVPIGQGAIDMPPPSTKRRSRGSIAQVKAEQQHGGDTAKVPGLSTPPASITTEAPVAHGPKSTQSSEMKTAGDCSEGDRFVHSICGKGFASRAKVRKHHWGAKNNDVRTKTGCWAKHKKPNVSWDEHPSCKEEAPAPRAVKKSPSQSTLRPKDSGHAAPGVPTMIPRYNTIEGFPTLQDLPQTVAQALGPWTPTRHSLENVGPYHSHRVPVRGSFETLLSAVNVASRIDAPKPEGRNDSVVSHLDAQAVAAEHDRQYNPAWLEASHGGDDGGFAYGRSPIVANALGISYFNEGVQVPSGMASSSQMGEGGYASTFDSNHEHMSNASKRDRTMFRSSISPDAETKMPKF